LSPCLCVSVREHISETTCPVSMLPMAVARFSGVAATRYTLPVYDDVVFAYSASVAPANLRREQVVCLK